MITAESKHVKIEMLNFCPEDCKYLEPNSDCVYAGYENAIIVKTDYCSNRFICKNAAEAYEEFKKKEEARKTEEARKEFINVTNEFKFR